LSHNHTEKPKNVDYFRVPRPLWRRVKKLLPKQAKKGKAGRRPADNRAILNGIWYVLWTSCQWKAVHKGWFGVCSSVLHQRFQLWQQLGIFEKLMMQMVEFYDKKRHIKWKWQALDSKSCPAPLGGDQTGKNPTDRAKKGSKLHLLVDQRGAPLSLYLSGANAHDKWFADDLIMVMVVKRPPKRKQHLCADKGYDYTDVRQFAEQQGYIVHIKHKRKRGEPVIEDCPVPGETRYAARRWVVERTLAWLSKRRSLRTRWCKTSQNWLAFIQFACAHILMDLAIYG
jgi:putative transposase